MKGIALLITAAVARLQDEPLTNESVELDEPRHNEVCVRLVATGICHTDALVRNQVYPTPLPAVLGHEGSGIVAAIGDSVTNVKPGDHVVLVGRVLRSLCQVSCRSDGVLREPLGS